MSSKPRKFVPPPPSAANLPSTEPALPEDWTVEDLDRLSVEVAKRIASDPSASPRDRFFALERLRHFSAGGTREPSLSRLYEDDLPEEGDVPGLLRGLREAGFLVLNVRDPGSWPEEVADLLFGGTDGGWSLDDLPPPIRGHVERIAEDRAHELRRDLDRRDGVVASIAEERRAAIHSVERQEQLSNAVENAEAAEDPPEESDGFTPPPPEPPRDDMFDPPRRRSGPSN